MPSKQTTCIIVDKTGTLKTTSLKEYKEEELYKKCGLKTAVGFTKQIEWKVKLDQTYVISMYGKLEGRTNMENKYDFPPPIDVKILFGSCLLVAEVKKSDISRTLVNLTIDLWVKIYEKLFGGFEDLTLAIDDEEDELENMPNFKKTKNGGYLKDGFVVSDSDENDYDEVDDDSNIDPKEIQEEVFLEDIGSELSEESYEYSDPE